MSVGKTLHSSYVCICRVNLLHAFADMMYKGMQPNEIVLALEQFIDAKIDAAVRPLAPPRTGGEP